MKTRSSFLPLVLLFCLSTVFVSSYAAKTLKRGIRSDENDDHRRIARAVLNGNIKSIAIDLSSLTSHQVSQYYNRNGRIIVRRGLPFKVRVTVRAPLQPSESLVVQTFPAANILSKSSLVAPLTYDLIVTTSFQSPVGDFIMAVALIGNGRKTENVNFNDHLIILFNALHPSDEAFLPDSNLKAEYLFNEYGSHWKGGIQSFTKSRWNFAQFDREALTSALRVLSKFTGDRSDPGEVFRFFSEYVNGGMLLGRWDGNYAGGTNPTVWSGSNEIFRQYVGRNFAPVGWAQCFNFGGVLTSLARTLGLASRQIFNFESVHEKSKNGKYKQYIELRRDTKGKLFWQEDGDVWNFHSWTEIWLNKRRDGHYPGWQVFDATPQEKSDGKYRLGPASVEEVKSLANPNTKYDVSFVRSEVAALIDNTEWNCDAKYTRCDFRRKMYTFRGGALILASDTIIAQKLDVTFNYKKAQTWRTRSLGDEDSLLAEVVMKKKEFGHPIEAQLEIMSIKGGKIRVNGEVWSTDYRGVLINNLKKISLEGILASKGEGDFFLNLPLSLSLEEYAEKLGSNYLKYSLMVQLDEAEDQKHIIDEQETHKKDMLTVQVEKREYIQTPSMMIEVIDPSSNDVVAHNRDNQLFFSLQNDNHQHNDVAHENALRSLASDKMYLVNISYINPLPTTVSNLLISINSGSMEMVADEKARFTEDRLGSFSMWRKTFHMKTSRKGPISIISTLVAEQLNAHGFLDLVSL